MDHRPEYLPLLLEVTKAITSTRDVNEVFDLIVRKVPDVMGVDAATIRLLDESGRKLALRAAHGLSDAYLSRGPVDAEESVMKALAGTPMAVAEAAEDDRFDYPDEARKEGIHSILVAPIPIRGEVRGILRLLTKTRREFEPIEIELAASLAEQCGIAIENARSHETLNRQLEYFRALYRIGKEINATKELDRILNLITARLPEVMDLKACTIRLIEETKGRFELKAAHGLSKKYLERGPLDEELATYYILEGEPVMIPDAKVDIHTIYKKEASEEGIGSILAVPITVQEETIGMLRLLTGEVRFFSDADINFALAVAQQGGIAIQNALDYQKTLAAASKTS